MRLFVAMILLVATAFTPATPADDSRFTFDVGCEYAGSAPDDAIVFPDQPGASHLHDFFGVVMEADWNRRDLVANPGNCNGDGNNSSYWAPSAFDNHGDQIIPIRWAAYYRAVGKEGTLYPFRSRLVMVTDDAEWGFRGSDGLPQVTIRFADCTDGRNDSPDHQSHVAFSDNGVCPPSHPRAMPRINFKITYPVQPVTLSSGGLDSAHADFANGWDRRALTESVQECLNRGRDATPDNVELCRSHR